ncbi:hypothetical protein M407DRAFT_241777 [Tulasnella calospora MUT 4182]|uniref:Uncharacterized protein n=1 Tax=Tulasnella calospora MUT 4182 TaxID=1051891 RepID=A0A0C3QTJ6_9AGAM|nr:hypothetical protein M407DRAFT_241777 [Tulasnella calospora MUT 4182]
MWGDAHSVLGLDIPGEEEEGTEGPAPRGPDTPRSEGRDVDPEIDGDEMNVDGGTEGTTREDTEDRASAAPQPQGDETPSTSPHEAMELKLTDSEELLNATALQTWPLVTSINNLVMENMCEADIAFLAASNEDLTARTLALEEQGRAEDVLLQQLYAAVMALDTSAQPDIDQLIDGIVNPVVNEIEAYVRGEFAQRARVQDEAWQAIGGQLETLMGPTVLVLRAILDKTNGLPPQNGHPNGTA